MSGKRRRFSGELKAEIALEALRAIGCFRRWLGGTKSIRPRWELGSAKRSRVLADLFSKGAERRARGQMPDLRAIYRSGTAEAAAARLDAFEVGWGERYPAIVPAWRRAWEHVVPMFCLPAADPEDDLHHG